MTFAPSQSHTRLVTIWCGIDGSLRSSRHCRVANQPLASSDRICSAVRPREVRKYTDCRPSCPGSSTLRRSR